METGLRISDLLGLRVADIQREFRLREQKNSHEKCMELSEGIIWEFESYVEKNGLQLSDYVFYSHESKKGKPVTRQWVNMQIGRVAKIRGLESIGTHSMRKIYACKLFGATRCLKSVQRAMGHKYASTTLAYLQDLLYQAIGS